MIKFLHACNKLTKQKNFNYCLKGKIYNKIKHNFTEDSKSKILKIKFDENNNRKIDFEDFSEYTKNTKIENSSFPYNKIKKQVSKIKFFGSENTEVEDSNAVNLDENSALKEQVTENLIKYDQFFSDYCRIYIKAGDGGNGLISHVKGPLFNDRTPQGGDGGKGGDVIFIADETVSSLSSLRKAHFVGNEGLKGQTKSMGGRHGRDLEIRVPVGTIVNELVRDENYNFRKKDLRSDKEYKIKQLVDMEEHGKKFVICKGGKGGVGNVTKRTVNKESKVLKGEIAEEKELELVLKCLADVGFIGYPNAGKSTLLAALTRAVPKIASYPFTTLHPHIGKLKFTDTNSLTVADLPGLIEGAHQNKGLGHKFLKHVERTKILLFVLDGSLDPYEKRSPLNDLLSLFSELSLYNSRFAQKPFLVALNKCDISNGNYQTNLDLLKSCDKLQGKEILSISGKEGVGMEELSKKLREVAEKLMIKGVTNVKK